MAQKALLFDEEEAIKFLQARGYRVAKVEYPEGQKVSTVPQLVSFFYARRRFYHPDRKFPQSMDSAQDRIFLGSFVKGRQKLGLDRQTAIKESAEIIDGLFRYESILNLDEPVLSPRILGVRSIVDRICSYLNGDVAEAGEMDTELAVKQCNDYYNRYFAMDDLRRADELRKSILEKLNEQK